MSPEEAQRLAGDAWIGLAALCAVLTILIVLDVVVRLILGPDPDLERPWDPRR